MIEPLIRLALRRGYTEGTSTELPREYENALVDEFLSKYAPGFRDEFRDAH